MIYDLQKASMGKRISAFLFDFILFITLFVGVALLISAVTGYDAKISELEGIYDRYEEKYDIVLGSDPEGYDTMTDEEKAAYDERYAEAEAEFSKDADAVALSAKLLSITVLMLAIGLFVTYLVMEFLIPLLLRDGQTVGKKIFGICLMRDDSVKVTPVILFIRAILGKYTIETMVPLFLIMLVVLGGAGLGGLIALAALLIFEITLMIKTKTNSTIHDLLSYTVVVDKESQMIFESKEALIEYKNRIHAEETNKKLY